MISAQRHLERIERAFLASGGVVTRSEISLYPSPLDTVGVLTMSMEYPTGHALHLNVTIDVSVGYPDWVIYSVQLLDPFQRSVFRYDNAPHHPDLETFPDHRHVGPRERPVAHPRPVLARLVREIIEVLDAATDSS